MEKMSRYLAPHLYTAEAYQSVAGNFYQSIPAVDVGQPIELPAESMTTFVLGLAYSLNVPDPALVYLYDPAYADGVFTVKVPDQPGVLFSLLENDVLGEGGWVEASNTTQSVSGGAVTFSNIVSEAEALYFRVKAERDF